MASLRKRKTLTNDTVNPYTLKRKHLSVNYIDWDNSKTIVLSFIQHLLERVSDQVTFNDRFSFEITHMLVQINEMDEGYFIMEDIVDQQPICMSDQQPIPEGRIVIGKVNHLTRLKKTARKRTEGSCELSLLPQIDRKNSNVELNPRERQILVHKMKKDCSSIRNSKYLSSSRPLGETRLFFQEADGPQTTILRWNLHHDEYICHKRVFSKIDKLLRKGKGKLATKYKKSKDFIDKIDPTNSICASERRQSLYKSGHRNSVSSICRESYPLEESIIVKQTKFKEIATKINPLKQIMNHKPIVSDIDQERSNRMMNVLSERYVEELRLRLDRSFHPSLKTKLSPSVSTSHTGLTPISLNLFPRLSQR